jgi:hypothetical protein
LVPARTTGQKWSVRVDASPICPRLFKQAKQFQIAVAQVIGKGGAIVQCTIAAAFCCSFYRSNFAPSQAQTPDFIDRASGGDPKSPPPY